jgi:hypothetical protein
MTTAAYLTAPTASGGLVSSHVISQQCTLSIDFIWRPRTKSPSLSAVAEIHQLPTSVDGLYSFRDLYSLLDATGRAAFESERRVFDDQLRERLAKDEISPLYFYRCLARMTQEQLAARSRSRQSFVSQVEKRKRPLTWKQAKKFAAALGIEPAQLMKGGA